MTGHCGKPGCAGDHQPGKCTAHRSDGSGHACQKAPLKGLPVCRSHGGASPTAQAAAAETIAEDQAQTKALRVVRDWQPGDLELSPVDVLVRTMTATYTQGALHRAQLAAEAESGTDPYVRKDQNGRQYPSPLGLLEQAERRLSADMAAKAIGAGLAERVVRLQERQAELVVAVLEAFARAVGLDPQAPEVRAAARSSLLLIEGAA